MGIPLRAETTTDVAQPVPLRVTKPRFLVYAIVLGTVALVVIGVAYALSRPAGAKTAAAEKRTLRREIHAAGRVEEVRPELRLPAPTGGIVKSVSVKESDVVAAGALLVSLQDDDAQAQLRLARSDLDAARAKELGLLSGARAEEVDQARARLAEAESAAAAARENKARMEALLATQAVTQAARDEAAATESQASSREKEARKGYDLLLAGARAEERRAAHAGVDAAEARLALAQVALNQRQLRAPFGGTVLTLFSHPGDAVAPLQPVLLLADLSALQARAEVDELSMGQLHPGQKTCAKSDAYRGVDFCGKLEAISSALGRRHFELGGGGMPDLKVVEVTASLPHDPRLVAGMAAELVIEVEPRVDVLSVPVAALDEHDGKAFVRLASGAEREVHLGGSDGLYREVTSGLEAGERVVIPQ